MKFEYHIGYMCIGLFLLIMMDAKTIFATIWILLVLITILIEKFAKGVLKE